MRTAVKKRPLVKAKAKKPFTGFKIQVRSRHPSHKPFRSSLPKLPFRTVVRLGSTWPGDGKARIECNSVEAVKTSASKLKMKLAFHTANVTTADWGNIQQNGTILIPGGLDGIEKQIDQFGFPIVAKHIYGSRGTGNFLLKTQEELNRWKQGKDLKNYIFEKFYDYSREYRLHVTKDGCFYTCRKMLREDTPENKRWFRNDSNSVWILEDNAQFDKPVNWDKIVAESVKALKAVGLDIGAIDVKVQSRLDKKGNVRKEPKFIILETNSAASHGDVTKEKYLRVVPELLKSKKAAQRV